MASSTEMTGTQSEFEGVLRRDTMFVRDTSLQVRVELLPDRLQWYPISETPSSRKCRWIPLSAVVGAETGIHVPKGGIFSRKKGNPRSTSAPGSDSDSGSADRTVLFVYTYLDPRSPEDDTRSPQRHQNVLKFRTLDGEFERGKAGRWAEAIHKALGVLGTRPQNLLVLVNPASGSGKAQKVWASVQDMFSIARIETTVVVTTRPKHALDMISGSAPIRAETGTPGAGRDEQASTLTANPVSMDSPIGSAINDDESESAISAFDGIVIVSGDGLLQEVTQGLLLHPQADMLRQKLSIGIIAGGSGNAGM